MLKVLKHVSLASGRRLGIFRTIASSRWRRRRLLILCYHGIALKDEHRWRAMFVTSAFFRRRMEILARGGYRVLKLGPALQMLKDGNLPSKSVVITFDDGFHDFYQEAFPVLRKYGFPATVYQTTFYSDCPFPIFNLVLSYVFWCANGQRLNGAAVGVPHVFDLSTASEQERAVSIFRDFARNRHYTPVQKEELAAQIAIQLGVDYSEIRRKRMLQLMTGEQLAEISQAGIDIQLHTHRHRAPLDESLFVREIRDNRRWIASKTGASPTHFCYPSGVHRSEFLPWLRSEQVISATTCENGLANKQCDPLLLPRLLDSMNLTETEFEGWLAGVGSLLPHRHA